MRLLAGIQPDQDILDLGCGNGELWKTLMNKGHRGSYIGIDFSLPLLKTVSVPVPDIQIIEHPASGERIDEAVLKYRACFVEADMLMDGWENPLANRNFQVILAFASLHHIPGEMNRASLLKTIYQRLAADGLFFVSVWQFLNSPRLVKRLQSWETAGLKRELVDPGDYLLDWKHSGYGLRYVHHFTEEELTLLATSHGFQVAENFNSDGEGGKLSLYQIWRKQG
jgi:SAM-dependent methyltransferase